MRATTAVPPAVLASGVATVAYASLIERTHWTLRRFDVPVLPPGAAPLRVLQLSDLHMTAGQRSKQEWVAGLADLRPDLVIDTGDNLAGADAVPGTLRALAPLLDLPGAFVLASNDYYAPRPKNPLKYFRPDHKRVHGDELPWRDLREGLAARGWVDLTNATGTLTVAGTRIALAGVDDPHLQLDRYDDVAGPADRSADVRIGLVPRPAETCSQVPAGCAGVGSAHRCSQRTCSRSSPQLVTSAPKNGTRSWPPCVCPQSSRS